MASYREPVGFVQMVEVLVHQVWVSLQEMGVQRLHHEADGLSIQLGAHKLGEHLWSGGG